MAPRAQLQVLLRETLESGNVYFQPPPNLVMKYPCIVYNLDDMDTQYADNAPYRFSDRYQLTLIDEDPDSETRVKLAALPMCKFERYFAADDLNHFVFNLFF